MPKQKTPSTGKTNNQTWRDLLPEGSKDIPTDKLFTREQLSEILARVNVKVSPEDLRYWEREGILPRAVRKWHDGASRSVYPGWYANLVYHLRKLQGKGYTLEQIRRRIEAHARLLTTAAADSIDADLQKVLAEAIPTDHRSPSDEQQPYWEPVTGPAAIPMAPELQHEIQKHAAKLERFTGVPVAEVLVTIVDEEGEELTYPISLTKRPEFWATYLEKFTV